MAYLIEQEPLTVSELRELVRGHETELAQVNGVNRRKRLFAYIAAFFGVLSIFALQVVFFGGFTPVYTAIFTFSIFFSSANIYSEKLKKASDDIEQQISALRAVPLTTNQEILEWCNRVPEIRTFADKVAAIGRGFTYREYYSMRRYNDDYDQIVAGREVFRNHNNSSTQTPIQHTEVLPNSGAPTGVRKVNIN